MRYTKQQIIAACLALTGQSLETIEASRYYSMELVFARMLTCAMLRELAGLSFPEVSAAIKMPNHSPSQGRYKQWEMLNQTLRRFLTAAVIEQLELMRLSEQEDVWKAVESSPKDGLVERDPGVLIRGRADLMRIWRAA
jgi:hypothetical protein